MTYLRIAIVVLCLVAVAYVGTSSTGGSDDLSDAIVQAPASRYAFAQQRANRSDRGWTTTITTTTNALPVTARKRWSSTTRGAAVTPSPVPPVTAQGDAKMFIYNHESGNNPASHNGSGCRGLGQACPGSKLPCSDSDYACQDKWFTGYMASRYGTWEKARSHWISLAHPCPKNPDDWCGGSW